MRLLCRALDDGFETLDALALIPYAVVHAVWAIGIDPSVLGSAAWMDWLGRQMKDELYRLCEEAVRTMFSPQKIVLCGVKSR